VLIHLATLLFLAPRAFGPLSFVRLQPRRVTTSGRTPRLDLARAPRCAVMAPASADAHPAEAAAASVRFSHVHLYCDSLKDLEEYKRLEGKLNSFVPSAAGPAARPADVAAGRSKWLALSETAGFPATGERDPAQWKAAGQDIVEQMLVGLGWRVTGVQRGPETTSLVVTSADPEGVKFVATAHNERPMNELAELDGAATAKRQRTDGPLDASHLVRFAQQRVGREGVAVLGFAVSPGGVDEIFRKYEELHPKLLLSPAPQVYEGAKILEVFAYYQGDIQTSDADRGTLIRFVEEDGTGPPLCVLPGVQKVDAVFDGVSLPAYCDHWVSNVVSREGFLETLEQTLGFTPKVDFNAGVVAAGEAQIESTVTGNSPGSTISDFAAALRDQSQVYLPINNALSEVGHVHLYLKEIGQGVQHIASRVADLPALVQNANDMRKMTGAGLSFLGIPRSYYGSLTAKKLSEEAAMAPEEAERCVAALREAGVVDGSDIVELEVTRETVVAALPSGVPESVADHVLRARYNNLYALLRDHIGEETYLRIVRNNILVDVQGEDLLMQIFTSNVLQRATGEESPFLEFIQRVCSEKCDPKTGCPRPMKPGCGGFGIRNFLTLFLSIEVSKAAKERAAALEVGDATKAAYFGKMVEAFTAQLDESNPILTAISDAMTAEGEALALGDGEAATRWSLEKTKGQDDLQTISTKYKALMRKLREAMPNA